MPHTLVRRAALTFAVLGTLAACNHDSTGPKVVPEYRSYVLQSVGGAPLPYYQEATTAGDTVTILAETVSLRTDGTATRTSLVRTVVGGGSGSTGTQSGTFGYQISGSQITLVPQCGPGANCIPGFGGTITDGQLSFRAINQPEAPLYVYGRILPN
ncbi:MAG TPA: hypothetical protein VFJ74_14020 [Gemmatimonadaceae bacterium]|nr:hypothetical protein [Gemmatimonadaceae bacterium]